MTIKPFTLSNKGSIFATDITFLLNIIMDTTSNDNYVLVLEDRADVKNKQEEVNFP